jgi:hypothetical protein
LSCCFYNNNKIDPMMALGANENAPNNLPGAKRIASPMDPSKPLIKDTDCKKESDDMQNQPHSRQERSNQPHRWQSSRAGGKGAASSHAGCKAAAQAASA